jgi:hypothetical protein
MITRPKVITSKIPIGLNSDNEIIYAQPVVSLDSDGNITSGGTSSGGSIDVDGLATSTLQSAGNSILTNIALNTNSLAQESTLQQLLDSVNTQIDLTATLWTDDSETYYVRRDIVNQGTGDITVTFTDATGAAATPGVGLRPLTDTNYEVLRDYYNVISSDTGYTVGNLLLRLTIIDPNNLTTSFVWVNLTTSTVLSSVDENDLTLRINTTPVTQSAAPWVTAIQSTVLPPGASTAANQTTEISRFTSIDTKLNRLTAAPASTQPGIVVRNIPSGVQQVSGSVSSSQTGVWNINNISGTVSLPKGAATSANQVIHNTTLNNIQENTTGLAKKTTLQNVLASLNSQINLSSTIWTDDTGDYYIRKDIVTSGEITTTFSYPNGSPASPSTGLKPIGDIDKTLFTEYYTVTTSGTGYSIGELLARIIIIDSTAVPPTSTTIWFNLTQDTLVSTVDIDDVSKLTESVEAIQSGSWNYR